MDQVWQIDSDLSAQDTAIIVPTRSLATSLNERIARQRIAQGQTVWEAPNILVWSDYLRLLWHSNRGQSNRDVLSASHTLISPQQALLLWNRVVEASRREESALTLLNVQQTSRAVQRSWRLLNDWQIGLDDLALDHVADTDQFLEWVEAYRVILNNRGLIDDSLLLKQLVTFPNEPDNGVALVHPFKRLTLVSYDLLTNAQKSYFKAASDAGVTVRDTQPQQLIESSEYRRYATSKLEIKAALEQARQLLEQDSQHTISIVVPDLQHRQTELHDAARDVFYPQSSPLEVQQNNNVFHFSLGQPLNEWAAIEAALSVLQLLKNRSSVVDLSFILRNKFLTFCTSQRAACREFEAWLKRQRVHHFLVDDLPDLYRECCGSQTTRDGVDSSGMLAALEGLVARRQALQRQLQQEKAQSGFAAVGFNEWLQVFDDWLNDWGWSCNTESGDLAGVQYQLQMRWQSLLEEFAGLAVVQKRAGLSRALEVLTLMARNAIFLPKAAVSPIVISGVLEAVGREVDTCILTGMHQDYPVPLPGDAFIANRLLQQAGHPEATAEAGFNQAQRVINNLLSCARNTLISYARVGQQDPDVARGPSPLFVSDKTNSDKVSSKKTSNMDFIDAELEPKLADVEGNHPSDSCVVAKQETVLEFYTDTCGPAWVDARRARGGSKIFENQSACAFKAFATHQLGFDREDEAEFGLDGLDRGNVLHHCLNVLWQEIGSQAQLILLDDTARLAVINQSLDRLFIDAQTLLSTYKTVLLQRERPRLQAILLDWLKVESGRPAGFSVVEREERREAEIAGIRFRYIIDRVDVTDDGRSVIIDYKTGAVNRNDWRGERLKSPQMPLYALALDSAKQSATSGIAFAHIKQGESKFIELAETDIFRDAKTKRERDYAEMWQENRAAWPAIFAQLAEDFLAGEASVEPIDSKTCQYCELHAMCRVSQLRAQT